MIIKKSVASLLCIYALTSYSAGGELITFSPAFYAGVAGGYGSTTWQGLVPAEENQNMALSMSTPIDVHEGGGVWGLFAGYEFTPALAAEFTYMRYPKARVSFDENSLFAFDNDQIQEFTTKTESAGLMAKIMLPVFNTPLRLYSAAGIADVHRNDMLINNWRLSPAFSVGGNYRFSQHIMAELVGNYTAGYGESQLNPTETYFPFLYSVTARLAWRF